MDFELSEDQVALREAASALAGGLCGSSRVREVAAGGTGFDRELWTAMAEQGWLAVERAVSDGGLGLGMVEVVVLCEQLGRVLAPVPFLGTLMVQAALGRAVVSGALSPDAPVGDVPLAQWLARLSLGEATGAVAWSGRTGAVRARPRSATRPGADAPGEAPDEAREDEWLLTGRTGPVLYGALADVVVVFADGTEANGGTDGAGLYALAVPEPDRPAAEPAMDLTRSVSWLELDDAPACRLGDTEAADALLDRTATAVSAEMLGSSARALEMSVEYAKERVQFGRPIGSFQAIKHRCADMLVDVEGMRSSVYYAGWAVGAGDRDAATAASAAKVWCSDAAARVMASALQVHGGIGFTWEHDLHLYVKRAQLDQVSFGDAVFHRERLARLLRPWAEAGLPVL